MGLTQVNSEGIKDGEIKDADVNASAAIALSKLASTPTLLTGSTNNQITTVTSANNIQGEATLTYDGTTQSLSRFSNNANSSILEFNKSRNGSVGGNTVVQDDDAVGVIRFLGADGTDYSQVADIQAAIDGTPGDNDTPGRISFSTTADGAQYTTERMRIDSSGNVTIGQTTAGYESKLTAGAGSGSEAITILSGTSSGGSLYFADGTAADNTRYRGWVQYVHTTDYMTLGTAAGERLRIDSNGYVTLPNQPSFSVKGSSTWHSVSSGQWGTFDLGTASHNVGSIYDTTNKRFTAPVAGVYQVNANMYSASADSNADTDEYCAMQLKLNGSNLSETWSIDHYFHRADQDNTRSGSWLIKMAVNDYIDLSFYASGRTWKYYGAHSSFSAHLLG